MPDREKLSSLEEGERACVEKLMQQGDMRRRLQDIGLIEGTRVECVLKSPWGDPVAYRIRGTLIALRNCDAADVCVHLCDES